MLPHKGRVSVVGLVGPLLWLDEAALDNLPYHHFKGLAVAFVQGQQEAGEHGEYHNQRGGAGRDAPPDQQKKRDTYKKRTAKTDQLPFRQSQYHLGFHAG